MGGRFASSLGQPPPFVETSYLSVHGDENSLMEKTMLRALFALTLFATPLAAQVTNYEAEGNLEPTHDVGCIALEDVQPDYSPADLFLGVYQCQLQQDYDTALPLMLLGQIRGAFDAQRVSDRSAPQAIQVMLINLANAGGEPWQTGMQAAFERFGGTGSEGHTALCDFARSSGVPQHSPRYMIQHGIKAFTGQEGDGLVDDFDAEAAWDDVIHGYLKCER